MTVNTSDLVEQLVEEVSCCAALDRRSLQRIPFFRPIKINTEDGRHTNLTAFSRDISPGGIGLLHRTALDNGPATISVDTGRLHQLDCDVQWSRPFNDDWFCSGARFNGISMRQAAILLSAVLREDVRRRLRNRYPFFRPVTVKNADGPGSTLSALCRDVSPEGIGLLHHQPLEPGRIIVEIALRQSTVEISAEIEWNEEFSPGWFISGGRFATVMLDEIPARFV